MCRSSVSAILCSSSFAQVSLFVLSVSRPQQRLDGAALVHRAVTLRDLFERQSQVKHFAGIDFPVQHQVDQWGR